MIEDQELREIYQVAGAEHVQNIEAELLKLEKDPTNLKFLQTILREAHSLKGDSRVIGVKSVEMLSHRLEEVIGRVKNGQLNWSNSLGNKMYETVGALGKLVHESVTDEPSGVEPQQLLNQLGEFLPDLEETGDSNNTLIENGQRHFDSSDLLIQDSELRDIYKISSEEHLEKFQSELISLAKNPENQEYCLAELLIESQIFELDCRIVGQGKVETLIHKIGEILAAIKKGEVKFNQVSQLLHQTLNVITALVKEALTGEPAQINFSQTIQELENFNRVSSSRQTSPNIPVSPQVNLPEISHLDTIRVPMRYLDALMTHAGELTVTKTRLAHVHAKVQDLIYLWEDRKNRQEGHSKNRKKVTEEKLDSIIHYLYSSIGENNSRLDAIARELDEKVRTLRLLPLSTIFLLFPRLVRELAQEQGKEVEFEIEGGEIPVDKQILEEMKDPLMHLLRNAVDHAIETPAERQKTGKAPAGKIWLKAMRSGGNIILEIGDDGRGLDLEKIKQTAIKRKLYRPEELATMGTNQLRSLIFLPGFSTRNFITEISGRGVGLDIVRTNVEKLKGNITIESNPNQGCVFSLSLRSTVSTLNVMLFTVQELIHALPVEAIEKTLLIAERQIYSHQGKPTISVAGQPISLVKMADLLALPNLNQAKVQKQRQTQEAKFISAILINIDGQRLAFEVEKLEQVLDVVIKPQTKLLKRIQNVIGATILGTGDVCMILNPRDLVKSVHKLHQTAPIPSEIETDKTTWQKPIILLTEDSIAVRTQEKRILEKAGYEVVIAVDGLDGYNKLRSGRHFDAVISDVQMPNLDGLGLTAKIRQHPEYRELPIILVTSLSKEEDKRRGAQAGANAYIVKDQFNQELLIETLERLV